MLPNNICILLKINFHANYALCGYFIPLIPVFCKFVEPNRFSTLKKLKKKKKKAAAAAASSVYDSTHA
jgi:hypothetical protein